MATGINLRRLAIRGHFVELAFAGRIGAIAIGMAGLCLARTRRWPTA
jgi:hypothetical protein